MNKPELNWWIVQLSSMVMTIGVHWELWAAALLKAVWWGMRLTSLLTHLFVCFFVCTVTDFSAAEKHRGVKFCMHVRLLSVMSFSHFGELWLPGSHGGGITSGMYAATNWMQAMAPSEAWWGFGIGCRGSVGQSELGATALFKTVRWDLHLASLLMHLFTFILWYSIFWYTGA